MRFEAIDRSCAKGPGAAFGALVVKTNRFPRTIFARGSLWRIGVTFRSNSLVGIPRHEWCRLTSIFWKLGWDLPRFVH